MRWQGSGLWRFQCPQNCQLFEVPLFLLQQLRFFPSQNGASTPAAAKWHQQDTSTHTALNSRAEMKVQTQKPT